MVHQSLCPLIFLILALTTSAKPFHQLVGLNSVTTERTNLNAALNEPLALPLNLATAVRSTSSSTLASTLEHTPKRRHQKLSSRGLISNLLTPTSVVHADVEICLDLSLKVLGIQVLNVQAVAGLTADINSHGISVQQLAIVQASVASQLNAAAKVATTAYACSDACDSSICQSSAFDSSKQACRLTPKELQPNSSILADLIGNLALQGSSSSDYCSLCPGKCATTPSARARRAKRSQLPLGLCPVGLNACPISPFSKSRGYECIDTNEEIESCGGCSATGDGINCNTVPGVKFAGCAVGKCLAFACEKGYNLTSEKACVPANI